MVLQESCFKSNNMQEPEGLGIPFDLVRELLYFCEYGSILSVGVKILHYTGCRIVELDNMQKDMIQKGWIYWKCGKNQHSWRKEYLPPEFIAEIEYYWNRNKTSKNRIIGVSSNTFTRYFRKIRPLLSLEWNKKKITVKNELLEESYNYELKGFRKNFATLLFAFFYNKYDDSQVAVQRVSKRMRHKTTHMTVNHYIETMEQIQAEKYMHLMPFEIIEHMTQARITDYV